MEYCWNNISDIAYDSGDIQRYFKVEFYEEVVIGVWFLESICR